MKKKSIFLFWNLLQEAQMQLQPAHAFSQPHLKPCVWTHCELSWYSDWCLHENTELSLTGRLVIQEDIFLLRLLFSH